MQGPKFAKVAVVRTEVKEKAKSSFDILEEVQAEMQTRYGIVPFPQPDSAPTPLSSIDIERTTNDVLETLFARYVGYAEFLRPKVAEAVAAQKISASNLRRIEANVKSQLKAERVPSADVAAVMRENVVVIEHEIEHLKLSAVAEMLDAYHTSYSRQAQALSRIVELRKLEFEQSHRGKNFNKRPAGSPIGGLRRND